MIQKHTIFLLVIILCVKTISGQTGSVKGIINDETGTALSGATISIKGITLGTVSDISGEYLLEDIPTGEQTISISHLGFNTITKSIIIVEGGENEINLVLKEYSLLLNPIKVTVSRRETDIQTTAASISAVPGIRLEALGKVDVTQFIDAVPGVTSVSNGSHNRVIFRNIATSTQEEGNPVSATYFDDFPISAPIQRGVPSVRLVDMNRVEVVKGPQGTLFGRSAMSGILRYIPNKPSTKNLFGGVNTYLSSTKDGGLNYGGYAFVNVPITKNLAIRAVGYTYQNSGFIDNVELNEDDINSESTWGGRLAIHWNPTDAFSVDLIYLKESMKNSEAGITTTWDPGDLDVAGDEGPDIPFDVKSRTAMWGTNPEMSPDYDFLNLKLKYDFNYFSTILLATRTKLKYGFGYDERQFVNVRSGTIPDETTHDDQNVYSDVGSNIVELRFVSKSDKFLDWVAGFYYEDTNEKSAVLRTYYGPDQLMFGFFELTDGLVLQENNATQANNENSFYGEIGLNFTTNTRFVMGYRRSNVKTSYVSTKADGFFNVFQGADLLVGQTFETEEGVNTFKVAIEQNFNKNIFAYALVASGYRPGGYNSPTAIAPFSTYNSDKLVNYELGFKATMSEDRLVTNVSAYLMDWNDIQLEVQDPVTYVRATQNVGKAQVMGLELSIQWLLHKNLRVTFGGSLSNSELKEDIPPSFNEVTGDPIYTGLKGDKLPGSATESFSLNINYDRPIGNNLNIFGNLFYRYVGDRQNDFNLDLDVKLPSYSLTDLRIGISHSHGWSVALFADNLFDESITYLILRQGPTFEYVPTNRPRTMGINLIYNFQ